MSIVVLKKKSNRFQNVISGKGVNGFSLVGGHRNIGVVGNTNLSKSVSRTRFRGTTPMGHGSSNGIYKISICNSGSCSNNDNTIIKSTVKNNKGSILKQYKWIHSAYPNYIVKSCDMSSYLFSQDFYIKSISSKNASCVINKMDSGIMLSDCSDGKDCKVFSYHIGGKRYYRGFYSKGLNNVPVSSGEYISTRYNALCKKE